MTIKIHTLQNLTKAYKTYNYIYKMIKNGDKRTRKNVLKEKAI